MSRVDAIGALNAALDELHRSGEPVDKAHHTLLLRAVQALKKGKPPWRSRKAFPSR